jgi:hypothetical protein
LDTSTGIGVLDLEAGADDGAARRDGWNTGTPNSDGIGRGPNKLVRGEGDAFVKLIINGDEAPAWCATGIEAGDSDLSGSDEDAGVKGTDITGSANNPETSIDGSTGTAESTVNVARRGDSSRDFCAVSDGTPTIKVMAGTERSDKHAQTQKHTNQEIKRETKTHRIKAMNQRWGAGLLRWDVIKIVNAFY